MKTISGQTTAVIGGGILGMTVALRLAQSGEAVTLIESAPHLGGMADAWQLGDVTWDRHYHVTLLSDMHWRRLLAEMRLEHDMKWVETRTGFFTDGRLVSMSNTLEFLRFPPLRLIDKLRLGATIFYASRITNGKRLESVPVARWLRRLSGRKAFEKIWLPLLRAKLGDNYKHTSAAFIWSTIARMYAARRTGLKKEMFGYVPGGYAVILEHFQSLLTAAGVDVQTGCSIESVRAAVNSTVNNPSIVIRTANGPERTFQRVVLTTPAPVISRCCPGLSAHEHEQLNGLRYQGIVCASLLLKNPLAEYYVTNITEDWVPFTAVIEMTTLVDRSEFGGRTLIYLPKYVAPDDPLFETSDEVLRETFLAALQRMYPDFSPNDVEAFRVSRVRHVVSLSTLNYSEQLPPMRTTLPGVFAVTSAHIANGTLNVNETVKLAEDVVQNVLLTDPVAFDRTLAEPDQTNEFQTVAATGSDLLKRTPS